VKERQFGPYSFKKEKEARTWKGGGGENSTGPRFGPEAHQKERGDLGGGEGKEKGGKGERCAAPYTRTSAERELWRKGEGEGRASISRCLQFVK